jgi:predicted nucleotidyltransferase
MTIRPETRPDLQLCVRFLQANPPPAGRILQCAVSGSHLYGFPSPDSDIDLKGIHLHPTQDFLGLGTQPETHDLTEVFEGVECDLTTNEAGHALKMLLNGNGNMLERILSPFQVVDAPEVEGLQDLARKNLSRVFYRHYAGYFRGMQEEHKRGSPPQAKSLLYTFRVALTGVHLLKTGEVLPDLGRLSGLYGMEFLSGLIGKKMQSREKVELSPDEDASYRQHWPALEDMLQAALTDSRLPEEAPHRDSCHDWLVSLRMEQLGR